jgi:hypothetical protein
MDKIQSNQTRQNDETSVTHKLFVQPDTNKHPQKYVLVEISLSKLCLAITNTYENKIQLICTNMLKNNVTYTLTPHRTSWS